jgi:hypothetical protein
MRGNLFLLLLHLMATCVYAKENVAIQPKPEWLHPIQPDQSKKPDLKEVSNGYFIELVDHQVNLITETDYNHFIRNIINESGVQAASEVSVTFAPQYQSVVFHYINLIRNGKVIRALSSKDIRIVQEETEAADYLYNGRKRAYVILEDTRKGDRIDAAYSVVGFNPAFDKYSTVIDLYKYNSICNYFETIIAPSQRKLFITSIGGATLPAQKVEGGNTVYHWNNPPLKEYYYASGAPGWYSNYPYLEITEYSNWLEVVDWSVNLFQNYKYPLPKSTEQLIGRWKALNNQEQLIINATRYVQDQIRYLGFEVGIHTHKPHDPGTVVKNGYGDCKDKSLLLARILQEAGVPAYVALVNTVFKSQMFRIAPAANRFNHAIVAIETEKGYKYIDPTISMQKGDLAETFTPAYGYALLVKSGETGLRAIEPGFLNSISITETLNASFSSGSTLQVYTVYKGGKADNMRDYFNGTALNDVRVRYTDYYKNSFKDIRMKGDVDVSDDSIENSVTVQERYTIPELWKIEKEVRRFSVTARSVDEQIPQPPSEGDEAGNYPLELSYPLTLIYKMNIELPETWTFPNDEIHVKNDYYQFDFEPEIVGRHVTLRYYFKTFSDHIPADALTEYRRDYEKISEIMTYDFSYTGQPGSSSYSDVDTAPAPNGWVFLVALAVIVPMVFLLLWVNKRTVEVEFDRSVAYPIGGWVVVLGITLGVGLITTLYSLRASGYQAMAWSDITAQGSAYVTMILFDVGFTFMAACMLVALIVWFLQRRDIFPRMFNIYVGCLLGVNLLLVAVYSFYDFNFETREIRNELMKDSVRVLVYAAIWCTFLWRSSRARATFLKAA